MSFLNLMRNKLKPKEVNDALENMSVPPAEDISYDNSDSGLTATNVQAAIDEVNEKLKNWSLIGNTAYEGTGLDVSNYKELYIVPKMQGSSPQNPIFILNNAGAINYGFPINSTYGFEFQTTISDGTLTISAQVLNGWTSATYDVYGK